jgi:hypothetical protein
MRATPGLDRQALYLQAPSPFLVSKDAIDAAEACAMWVHALNQRGVHKKSAPIVARASFTMDKDGYE